MRKSLLSSFGVMAFLAILLVLSITSCAIADDAGFVVQLKTEDDALWGAWGGTSNVVWNPNYDQPATTDTIESLTSFGDEQHGSMHGMWRFGGDVAGTTFKFILSESGGPLGTTKVNKIFQKTDGAIGWDEISDVDEPLEFPTTGKTDEYRLEFTDGKETPKYSVLQIDIKKVEGIDGKITIQGPFLFDEKVMYFDYDIEFNDSDTPTSYESVSHHTSLGSWANVPGDFKILFNPGSSNAGLTGIWKKDLGDDTFIMVGEDTIPDSALPADKGEDADFLLQLKRNGEDKYAYIHLTLIREVDNNDGYVLISTPGVDAFDRMLVMSVPKGVNVDGVEATPTIDTTTEINGSVNLREQVAGDFKLIYNPGATDALLTSVWKKTGESLTLMSNNTIPQGDLPAWDGDSVRYILQLSKDNKYLYLGLTISRLTDKDSFVTHLVAENGDELGNWGGGSAVVWNPNYRETADVDTIGGRTTFTDGFCTVGANVSGTTFNFVFDEYDDQPSVNLNKIFKKDSGLESWSEISNVNANLNYPNPGRTDIYRLEFTDGHRFSVLQVSVAKPNNSDGNSSGGGGTVTPGNDMPDSDAPSGDSSGEIPGGNSEPTIPTQPPTVADTTITIIITDQYNPDKRWTITITTDKGLPIPDKKRFYFWFVAATQRNSRGAGISSSYGYGPFVTESVMDSSGTSKLDIDVEKLKKPDGTPGSVPSGSYKIQFADADTGKTYVGTSNETLAVKGTGVPSTGGTDIPSNETSNDDSGNGAGGGCDTGVGGLLALSVGATLMAWRKRS